MVVVVDDVLLLICDVYFVGKKAFVADIIIDNIANIHNDDGQPIVPLLLIIII